MPSDVAAGYFGGPQPRSELLQSDGNRGLRRSRRLAGRKGEIPSRHPWEKPEVTPFPFVLSIDELRPTPSRRSLAAVPVGQADDEKFVISNYEGALIAGWFRAVPGRNQVVPGVLDR